MNGWVVLLWSFVAALVLIIAGIFGSLVVMGRISLFPDAGQSAAPTPVETGVVDTSITVMILNGTPDEGLATQMRDTLVTEGWSADDVFAGDSSSQDFATTTVFYVDAGDELAARGLADVLGGAAVQQSDYYPGETEDGRKQFTVVIGLDRSSSAPETPDEAPAS